jgi:hypothetical protein
VTTLEIRNRYDEITTWRMEREAWMTRGRQALQDVGVPCVEMLPEEVRAQLEEGYVALRTEAEIVQAMDDLKREIQSAGIVLELQRMYFLPDLRD